MKWEESPFAGSGRLSIQRTFKPVAGNTNGLATEHLKCIGEYRNITRSRRLHISKSGIPVKFFINILHSKVKQSTVSTALYLFLAYPIHCSYMVLKVINGLLEASDNTSLIYNNSSFRKEWHTASHYVSIPKGRKNDWNRMSWSSKISESRQSIPPKKLLSF